MSADQVASEQRWLCSDCRKPVKPVLGAARDWWASEHGRVERTWDVCPECRHVVREHLTGPGARAWAAARAIQIVT